MDYGSKVTTVTNFRGGHVQIVTTYKESVMVASEQELLAEILRHLEFCKKAKKLDPSFELDTDRSVGSIKRLVKGWSEIG